MASLPSKNSDFVQFCNTHGVLWNSVYAQVGITQTAAAAFKTASVDLNTKYQAALAARAASVQATNVLNAALTATRRQAGDLVAVIKGFADTSANPAIVYQTADITPPSNEPQRNAPPAQPTKLNALLNMSTGAIELSWKATNPGTGTSYYITRKLAGETSFRFIGVATSKKKFVDDTIPAGTRSAQFVVTGQRGSISGEPSEVFTVNFGIAGPTGLGEITSQFSGSGPDVKLAA